MAYIGMARHSTSAFNECSTTRMLAERLESSGKIKTFFKENDRTPNYDGSVELVGHEGVPTKQFIVQIKKTEDLTVNSKGVSKGKYTYRMETKFLYYVKEKVTESPAIYFVVDITTKNIFWLYLSDSKLMSLNFEGKEYISYHFSESDIIKSVDDFTDTLNQIATARNSVFIQKTSEQIAELQDALDYINRLMENDLRVIRDVVFPNLWRFGIKHSHSNSFAIISGNTEYRSDNTSLFSLYPQIKGVPDTGLREYRGDELNFFAHFDMRAKTLPMDYVKDCLYKIIRGFFETGIPMEYLPDILLMEKIGRYVNRLKRLYCFKAVDEKIPISELYRISTLLIRYTQHILLDPVSNPDELVMKNDWHTMLQNGKHNIIDIFNYSNRAVYGFQAFCKSFEGSDSIFFSEGMMRIIAREHLEAWCMIATLQKRNVEYYKNIWVYEYYDIIKHEQVVALKEINDLCIQWTDTLQRVYIDVYDKLFDNRKYQLKDKYIYKNHCISDGTSRPWLSTTICKYESDSFSIAYDSYCPEDFDVKNPPVSIRHTLFFEEFLARKTPLYDGLHCLLYKGVCDALGFKAEGLTRDCRRLSLL